MLLRSRRHPRAASSDAGVDRENQRHALFDKGWNELRDEIFANQKRLGVIPADAKLTPWPDKLLKRWDALTADEKKIFIRQVEVYAAYLAYTDHEIGRVIQAVDGHGQARQYAGYLYQWRQRRQRRRDADRHAERSLLVQRRQRSGRGPTQALLRPLGLRSDLPHMAVAWSWAFDTPYKWTKQIASHFGGTRQGMCIAWPGHIKDAGGIRHQFHHVVDIVPTILESAGISAPAVVNGIRQKPIEGLSMAYTFDKKNADEPSAHKTQYFEMMGVRAIYHDGWVAATTPIRPPWDLNGPAVEDPSTAYKWELYDLSKDWTEYNDVAASHPQKLKELQDLFWKEARKYQVLPLDASVASRLVRRGRILRRAGRSSPTPRRWPASRSATLRAC